ncbi:MAG: YncE family protein [Gemmatimonadales bacterium]|nr:MAG: YncE family protein [Gemmatimonadales bacterium]
MMPNGFPARKRALRRKALHERALLAFFTCFALALPLVMEARPLAAQGTGPAPGEPSLLGETPDAHYWVYVGAESADLVHRIHLGPQGARVEHTFRVGELAAEMEGPHGLVISPDGRYLHLTTGHGFPDGKYWKYELGPDSLVAPGVELGVFPASIDVTPDGLYTFSVNFNLHGDMVPSTISVVYTPSPMEVGRIVTCTMPHGSRFDARGAFHYSTCMMDDQLVEIDTRSLRVSRRFSLAQGREGPLPADAMGHGVQETHGGLDHAPGPGGSGEHAGHGAHIGHHPPTVMEGPSVERRAAGPSPDPAEVGYTGPRHLMAPSSCSPTWVQPSADDRSLFVTCNKADELLEVDRSDWTLLRRIATGRGPYNVEVTPDGALLLVTLKQGGQFQVLDAATGEVRATFDNSTTVAHGVVVSPDSRYAFVSSEGVGSAPGMVDIYDLQRLDRVAVVPVGQQAGGIAFWKMEPPVDAPSPR